MTHTGLTPKSQMAKAPAMGIQQLDSLTFALFAKEKEKTEHFDYYIFGHRHIELDLELVSGARVVILGDCFRQWTYAAMDEQGKLELLCIQEQNS